MINRYIAKALVEWALFCEFTEEQTLNPDAAVAAMEQMAATLQCADDASKRALTMLMGSMAADYPEHSDFVEGLPAALGIDGQ